MTVTRIGKSIEEHTNDMMNNIVKGLEKGVKAVEADSKMLVGVDTGRLRGSLTSGVSIVKNTAVGKIGSNVEYAFFHSLQNPYLENALDKNLAFISQSIISEVR